MTKPLGAGYWKLWTASVISNLGDGVSAIAYPWLASAVTRNPIHIAAVALVTRLPWLLFSLPAGVVTDRVDRRRLAAWMDVFRFLFTLAVAFAVLATQAELSSPDAIAEGVATPPAGGGLLLVMVYAAAFLLGCAEVFRDNAAQTLMPALVDKENLEKANGRMWGAEMIMNSFVGPPLAGILLAAGFAIPFFLDAGSFAVAAGLVFAIAGSFRPQGEPDEVESVSFWTELKGGVKWLWDHPLFRPMAIALGVLNGTMMMAMATFVLFAQEILVLDATRFGLLTTGAAVGGVVGSLIAARFTRAVGQGTTLFVAIVTMALAMLVSGVTSSFWVFWSMGAMIGLTGTLWNVVSVSLRQSIIPDRILGRVNSVYRFIGWGMMPIGSALGGVIVAVVEPIAGRQWALRSPFLVGATITLVMLMYALPRLNTASIEAAKQAAPV